MSDSKVASSESLLQEEHPRNARCGGKALVFLAFVVGLGFAAFLTNGGTMQEPTVDMAVQPRVMQPVKTFPFSPAFRQAPMALPFVQSPQASARDGLATNALRNPSALASSGATLGQQRLPDVRKTLGLIRGSSAPPKCVYANRHASLCGDLVVLRPDTAVHAEGQSKSSSSFDADKLLKDVTEKWDAVEDKTTATIYAGGALVALIFANNILATVNALPLLPQLFETVGVGYSAYFAYRYLLTKSSREELIADIEELKEKVTGTK